MEYKPGDFAPLFNTRHSYFSIFGNYKHQLMAETFMQNSQRNGEWAVFDAISPDYDEEGLLENGIFEKVPGGFALTDAAKEKIHAYERDKNLETFDERKQFEAELEKSRVRIDDMPHNPGNLPGLSRIDTFYHTKEIIK